MLMGAGEIMEFAAWLVCTALYVIGTIAVAFLLIVLFVDVTYVPHEPPTRDEWRHM